MQRRFALAMLLVTVAGACGDSSTDTDNATTTIATGSHGVVITTTSIDAERGAPIDDPDALGDLMVEVGELQVYAASHQAETFAGLWMEPDALWVNVAYVTDAAGAIETLRSRFSMPELLHPVDARHTARELDESYRAIFTAQLEMTQGLETLLGAEFGGYIDVPGNVIRIVTLDTAVISTLQATYSGDLVEVVQDTPPTTILD